MTAAGRAIRVLIADDDAGVREGLVDLLSSEEDMEVVASAEDAESAIEIAAALRPDIAVVDVKMPGGGGPEATRGIRAASPVTRVVAYSVHDDPTSIRSMIRAGARSYVVKDAPIEEVLEAIREASVGRGHLAPAVAVQVVDELAVELEKEERHQAEHEEVSDLVDRALEKGAILPLYQAIVDLQGWRVAGVEALARFQLEPPPGPDGVPLRWGPDKWFDAAGRVGKRVDLELAALRVQAAAFEDPALGQRYLSLNAEPETILDKRRRLWDALVGLPWERVVLEVTEHAVVSDYAKFAEALRPFREAGGRLAVDDAGSGYSSMQHIVELQPEIIKIDISLTRDLDTNVPKRAMARALATFAQEMEMLVVAEGIETPAELEVLRDMGVKYGQGWFMRKAAPLAAATGPLVPLDALTAAWLAEHGAAGG